MCVEFFCDYGSLGKGSKCFIFHGQGFQLVKNPPAMWETWVRSLGQEDPLEKGKTTHSSVLAWRSHGLYSPWRHKDLDTTECLSLPHSGLGRASHLLRPEGSAVAARAFSRQQACCLWRSDAVRGHQCEERKWLEMSTVTQRATHEAQVYFPDWPWTPIANSPWVFLWAVHPSR